MSDVEAVTNNSTVEDETPKPAEESSPVSEKKTPVKRTPSKRMSFIERAQKESEELVKTMGGSLEMGGRRTRSSARVTPTRASIEIPPPSKKSRDSPVTSTKTTPSRARGRGRKIETNDNPAEEEDLNKEETIAPTPSKKNSVAETPTKQAKVEATPPSPRPQTPTNKNIDAEESSVENAENSVVDAANSAAAAEEASLNATVEKAANDENIVQSEDDPDAAPLETVPEEQQNHVEDLVEETKKLTDEPPKSESPMETDIVEDIKETTEAPSVNDADVAVPAVESAAVVAKEKEPTPEPMEVDSSTTSNDANDVIEVPPKTNDEVPAKVVADHDVKENDVDSSKNNSNTQIIVAEAETEAQPEKITTAVDEVVAAKNDTNAEEPLDNVKPVPPTEVKDVVDTTAAVDLKATKIAESLGDSQKTENNDCCEPKIASPPITAGGDSAVSTPQYCN